MNEASWLSIKNGRFRLHKIEFPECIPTKMLNEHNAYSSRYLEQLESFLNGIRVAFISYASITYNNYWTYFWLHSLSSFFPSYCFRPIGGLYFP